MENLINQYVFALMTYIEMEYDNIPDQVTDHMEACFLECFREGMCLPNAAGLFWERFLRSNEIL